MKVLILKFLIRIVSEHHENYDGNGYPGKIKGENIHEMARLTAIADFFDALTTKRSYHEKNLERRCSGYNGQRKREEN